MLRRLRADLAFAYAADLQTRAESAADKQRLCDAQLRLGVHTQLLLGRDADPFLFGPISISDDAPPWSRFEARR